MTHLSAIINNVGRCIFLRITRQITLFTIIVSILLNIDHAYADISAQAAILIECSSNKIIYEKSAYDKLPMASTTKIMTALCAIENSNINTIVEVDKRAVGVEGSSVYLEYGEKISIHDLLYGLMLHSGNDAAEAIAYAVSGSKEKFVALMNKTAKKIGATNTHFKNPSGLYDDEHYTTAYDLACISSYAMKNKTFSKIVSAKNAKITNGNKSYDRVLTNHNKLLNMYSGCIGIKTGYTKKCGRCLVSCAEKDGIKLICVTLNAPDDWNDHITLLNSGFSKCKNFFVAQGGDYALKVKTEAEKYCIAEFSTSLGGVCVNSDIKDLKIKYTMQPSLKTPISSGQKIGKAELFLYGAKIDDCELIARNTIIMQKNNEFKTTYAKILKKFLCIK